MYLCGLGGSDYVDPPRLKAGGDCDKPEVIKPDPSRVTAATNSFKGMTTIGNEGPTVTQVRLTAEEHRETGMGAAGAGAGAGERGVCRAYSHLFILKVEQARKQPQPCRQRNVSGWGEAFGLVLVFTQNYFRYL